MEAERPSRWKALRARTQVALGIKMLVQHRSMCDRRRNLRHKRHGDRRAEQGEHGDEARDTSAETTTACNEAGEEGDGLEEQGDQDEDPAKAPQEELSVGGSVASAAADERAGRIARVRVPGTSNNRSSASAVAVVVASAAGVEEVPLGDFAGT
jgi:hypothetical protein